MHERRATALASFFGLFLVADVASAQTASQRECTTTYESAQIDMKASPPRLLRARTELLVCIRDQCAGFIRKDCRKWLEEVEAKIPSVVFEADRDDGKPVGPVRVHVDGKSGPTKIDGSEVFVDPGGRSFVFEESTGLPPVKVDVVVNPGEKLKRVRATFHDPEEEKRKAEEERRRREEAARQKDLSTKPRWVDQAMPYFLVAAGIGIAGFTFFGLRGNSLKSDLDSCKGACEDGAVDDVLYSYIAADACLVVSLTALGFVGDSLFTRPSSSTSTSTSMGSSFRLGDGRF